MLATTCAVPKAVPHGKVQGMPQPSTIVTRVHMSIEAHLCGPISVGTVHVIRALHECLELPLPEAVEYVNRCVFGAETVVIDSPSLTAAERFSERARSRRTPATLHIRIES